MKKRHRRRLFGPTFRIPKRAFPRDLARVTTQRWENICGGEYVAPPCPPKKLLQELLEVVYLTATAPEESRFPSFNVVTAPAGPDGDGLDLGRRWAFDQKRQLSVSELRRLAPAVDLRKSAIWIEWDSDRWAIVGLVDLGTSWHRARMGLEYNYRHPSCLLLQIDRPGRIRVYQGGFQVATLSDGEITGHEGIELQTALGPAAANGLRILGKEIIWPKIEEPREFENFAFTALWNTYAAIANSVGILGHGGALIVIPANRKISAKNATIKYRIKSSALRSAFVSFMNARNVIGDLMAREENGETIPVEVFSHAQINGHGSFVELVEATRFVAQLSGCDGAIVISDDLRLIGFGAEIRAELRKGWNAVEVFSDFDVFDDKSVKLDIEEFGMRHRSAVKFVSQESRAQVLVVSQDGPVSAIWSKKKEVVVRRGVNLVNMDMPWA